jgi:Glycosyl transferase WecG/TagA/CpsF family
MTWRMTAKRCWPTPRTVRIGCRKNAASHRLRLQYLDNWSLLLDFKIGVLTLFSKKSYGKCLLTTSWSMSTVGGLPIAALGRRATATLMVQVANEWAASVHRHFLPPPTAKWSRNVRASPNSAAFLWCVAGERWRTALDDDVPVIWRIRASGTGGHDRPHDVARIAVHRDLSFAIYGATADENAKALCSIRKIYPQVRTTRFSRGCLTEDEQRKFVAQAAAARTDILWVCLGVPREQQFHYKLQRQLTGAGVVKTGGGPAQFSFRQLPTSPASDSKSRIGVAIQGRDVARRLFLISVHESSSGYSLISNGKISLKWRQFIQERKFGKIVETKHSAAQEEPDSVSSVK